MNQFLRAYIYLFLVLKDALKHSFGNLDVSRAIGLLVLIEVGAIGGLLIPYLDQYYAPSGTTVVILIAGLVAILYVFNYNSFLANKDWEKQEKAFYKLTSMQRNLMRVGTLTLVTLSIWLSLGRYLIK